MSGGIGAAHAHVGDRAAVEQLPDALVAVQRGQLAEDRAGERERVAAAVVVAAGRERRVAAARRAARARSPASRPAGRRAAARARRRRPPAARPRSTTSSRCRTLVDDDLDAARDRPSRAPRPRRRRARRRAGRTGTPRATPSTWSSRVAPPNGSSCFGCPSRDEPPAASTRPLTREGMLLRVARAAAVAAEVHALVADAEVRRRVADRDLHPADRVDRRSRAPPARGRAARRPSGPGSRSRCRRASGRRCRGPRACGPGARSASSTSSASSTAAPRFGLATSAT